MIGVPDERWGETVKALVVRAPGSTVDADELVAFARERLAGYKLPRSVEFVAELPRSPAGKVLKRELRARYVSRPTLGRRTRWRRRVREQEADELPQASGTSVGNAWAPPGRAMNCAPAMPSASSRPFSSGRIRSCSPCMTSVGAVIAASRARGVVCAGDRVLTAIGARIEGTAQAPSDVLADQRRVAAVRRRRRRDMAPTPTDPPRRGGRRAGGRTGGSAVPVRRTASPPAEDEPRTSERDALRMRGSRAPERSAPPKDRPTTCAWSTPAPSSRATASCDRRHAAPREHCESAPRAGRPTGARPPR